MYFINIIYQKTLLFPILNLPHQLCLSQTSLPRVAVASYFGGMATWEVDSRDGDLFTAGWVGNSPKKQWKVRESDDPQNGRNIQVKDLWWIAQITWIRGENNNG